jgi:hypothetical protein
MTAAAADFHGADTPYYHGDVKDRGNDVQSLTLRLKLEECQECQYDSVSDTEDELKFQTAEFLTLFVGEARNGLIKAK